MHCGCLQDCLLLDGSNEVGPASSDKKSSKDKKAANGQTNDSALVFNLKHKVPDKNLLKGESRLLSYSSAFGQKIVDRQDWDVLMQNPHIL